MAAPLGSKTSLPRGRRSARPSGDDRELAILATAEQLLEKRPLSDISVDDLAKGAGISRPTFYFYFASKDAVLLTLFERILAEADATFEGRADDYAAQPARAWRDGLSPKSVRRPTRFLGGVLGGSFSVYGSEGAISTLSR